jgi:hypothetical protein
MSTAGATQTSAGTIADPPARGQHVVPCRNRHLPQQVCSHSASSLHRHEHARYQQLTSALVRVASSDPTASTTSEAATVASTPFPADYTCGPNLCPSVAGLWAKVLGRSGKIDLAPSANVASDPNKIRLEISGLRELDSIGTELGAGGSTKHSFNSFATQDFMFGAVQDTAYGGEVKITIPKKIGGESARARE